MIIQVEQIYQFHLRLTKTKLYFENWNWGTDEKLFINTKVWYNLELKTEFKSLQHEIKVYTTKMV